MEFPRNQFKLRLTGGETQYGMWVSLADPVAAEISAGAGFDWLMIDAEHSPNDLRTLLVQLQAVAAYPVSAVIRPPIGDPVIIKRYLDIGAQTILVPMVETAEQAEDLVGAMRYPPQGIRGVATGRSSRWGRVENYWREVDDEMCLLVQIETVKGVSNLMDIARVDGIDGIFIGPSDLGAALGHIGDPMHPNVRTAVTESIAAVCAAGKPAGVLSTNQTLVREFRDAGASFVAVGVDTSLLAKQTSALADAWIGDTEKN